MRRGNKQFCGNAKQRRVARRRAVRTYLAQRAANPAPPHSVFGDDFGELELAAEEVCIHLKRQPYVRFQFIANPKDLLASDVKWLPNGGKPMEQF